MFVQETIGLVRGSRKDEELRKEVKWKERVRENDNLLKFFGRKDGKLKLGGRNDYLFMNLLYNHFHHFSIIF